MIETRQCRRCFLVLESKDFYAKRATCKWCLSKGVRGRPKTPASTINKINELRSSGMTLRQISVIVGLSFATVGRLIRGSK